MFGRKSKTNEQTEVEEDVGNNTVEPTDDSNHVYPAGLKLAALMSSTYIGMFLVALDKLIIATAIPAITNDFHAANEVGWYGTAYLLCNAAFLPVFGKVYKVFDVKITFLAAVILFEVGSAICGAAPNSIAFILGRAIAGAGAAAVQSGCLVIIVYSVPLARRPKYLGFVGALFGISSILGPTVGGAFTSDVTWRWCFYINLPLGAVVLTFITLFLQIPDRESDKGSLKHKLIQLNFEGLLALLPGVVCLCLALQWGGFTYSWSNGRIIALLVLAVVLLISFILIQIWRPQRALIPPHIFTQRSIVSGFIATSCLGAAQTIVVYYLPIWFQAIKGDSAVKSGVHLLGLTLALVVATISTGILTGKIGYYTPFLIAGICLSSVGLGLLNTLRVHMGIPEVIGFEILSGFGLGLANQAPNMAAQTVLHRDEISIGVSLMQFGQTLFGAMFVSIGQNVLEGSLASGLRDIIKITPQEIEKAGTTGLLKIIPPQQLAAALEVYNRSLRMCFRVSVIMACIAIFGGLTMEWRSVKGAKKNPSPEENAEGTEANGDEGSEVEVKEVKASEK